jgi:sentrin-specific protease 1
LEGQVVLSFKRRSIANDYNVRRRPENVYRDIKIFKYKSRLQQNLSRIPNNQYFNYETTQVIANFLSQISHLYAYNSDNKNCKEIVIPNITNKLDYYKNVITATFRNFTSTTNFNIQLTKNDIDRLKPHCWLNDNIVNYYLYLLIWYNRVNAMNFESYFYQSLALRGCSSVYNYFKNVNIFNYELIFVPINIYIGDSTDNQPGNHWILAPIEIFRCKVTVYDSYHLDQSRVLNHLKEYLNMKYLQFYGVPLTDHWVFTQEFEIPLQRNSSDCGVFSCKIAHHKALGSYSFYFLAKEMAYFVKIFCFQSY